MSDAPTHLIHGRLLTVLCGAEEIEAAIVWTAGADIAAADCETCIKRVPANLKREQERAAILARKPAARPLRDGETLGRAGRDLGTDDHGKRLRHERARDMTPVDRRRMAMDAGAAYQEEMVVVTEREPLRDDETGDELPIIPWQQGDDSRGLQHLDGKAEARPPKEWEDLHARERDVEFYFDREAMNADLLAARKAKPLHEQLRDLEHAILALQTQKARTIPENDAAARPGATEGSLAPQGEGEYAIAFLDERGVNSRMVQIEWHIDEVWRAIDAHQGRGVKDVALMTTEEKNALLTGPALRDCTPEEIHALHPALGAPSTIAKVRGEAGQDKLGNPKRRTWTDEENRQVQHSTLTVAELAQNLGRSEGAIYTQRTRLNERALATRDAA